MGRCLRIELRRPTRVRSDESRIPIYPDLWQEAPMTETCPALDPVAPADQLLVPRAEAVVELNLANGGTYWVCAWTCVEPDCDCHTVRCMATWTKEELEKQLPFGRTDWPKDTSENDAFVDKLGEELIAFRLDFYSGVLSAPGDWEKSVSSNSRFDPILASLQLGDTLQAFARIHAQGRGLPGQERMSPPEGLVGWKPGAKVMWMEAYETLRVDVFRLGGEFYQAIDFYCVNPVCQCEEVLVGFSHVTTVSHRDVGMVEIRGASPAKFHLAPVSTRPLLKELWDLYVGRFPKYRDHLAVRRKKMTEFGVSLFELNDQRVVPRIRPWVGSSRKGGSKKRKQG